MIPQALNQDLDSRHGDREYAIYTLAATVTALHGKTLALDPVLDSRRAPHVPFSSDSLVYRAARRACAQMGFIPADAHAVAQAWQTSAERSGHFDPLHWPDDPADFGIDPFPRANAFASCPQALGLYAVLPDAAWVGRMARAGVPTVQLRFKSDDISAVRAEVQAAVLAIKGTDARLFINDHWREAIDAGAYGVHLGQEDLALTRADDLEAIRRAGLRLGLSTHGYAEMLRVDAVSPSYIALGAVFPTTLKAMTTPSQGTGRLAAYAKLLRDYPLVAIGGIDAARLSDVLRSGVGSVGVVRALVAAEDPEGVAAQWRTVISAAP